MNQPANSPASSGVSKGRGKGARFAGALLTATALLFAGGQGGSPALAQGKEVLQRTPSAQAASVRAEKGTATEQRSNNVAQVVRGILGYSRWPDEDASVQLCVIMPTDYLDALKFSYPAVASPQQQVQVRQVRAEDVLRPDAAGCDAVYLGNLAPNTRNSVLQGLVGKPVLTISESSTYCNDGSLFCLRFADAVVTFEVNLDSVARSGIRINPYVLKLAKPAEVAANP